MRTYLLAKQSIVFGNHSHCDAGQIFLVASNDNAVAGYHARAILRGELCDEQEFAMDYSDPDAICAIGHEYDESGYVFVPAHAVDEFTDEAALIQSAKEYFESDGCPYFI